MRQRVKSLLAAGLATMTAFQLAAPVQGAAWQEENSQIEALVSEPGDESQIAPLLITEIATDQVSGKRYTYVEVFNNSDQRINFTDYTLFYDYPGGGGKVFSNTITDKKFEGRDVIAYGNEGEDVYIEPGKTLVLWQSDGGQGRTLEDFNRFYGTNLVENVDALRLPYSGIHPSEKRGYRIGKDTDGIVAEAYSNENGDLIAAGNPNKEAYQYMYTVNSKRSIETGVAAATPGVVTEGQVPTSRVKVVEKIPEIGKVEASGQGNLTVTAEIPYEGTAVAMSVNLYYRQKAEGIESELQSIEMQSQGDGKTFIGIIEANQIFGQEAEYYIEASYSAKQKTTSEIMNVGLTPVKADLEKSAPLIITEVAPTSVEDGQERYDYFEVYNQSNKTINLGYYKILYYYNYPAQTAAQSGKTWSLDDFRQTLAPGETMVYWLNSKNLTVDQFNHFYGTDLVEGKNIVSVNYGGLHASQARWLRIGTGESDAFTLAAFNTKPWQITTSGNSLHYAAPNDAAGVNESIPVIMGKSTPGTVEAWQVPKELIDFRGYSNYQPDDGKKPTLSVCTQEGKYIPKTINEGETLTVMYDVDLLMGAAGDARVDAFRNDVDTENPTNHPGGSEELKTRPRMLGTEIYYKLDQDKEWTIVPEKKQWVLGHYQMQIPADILYGHDEVTFKVRAYNLYGYNETAENTVRISRLNDTKGKVRLNVADQELLSGITTITANDGKNNQETKITVDGNPVDTRRTFEGGAYFMVKTSGMDSYFKNAVTAPYGENQREIITIMSSWCELPASRAIRVDNKYFTYNQETGNYDVTLTIWAGSSGTPFEEIYDIVKNENHEDFKVYGLQMKLINGKSYLPTAIAPDNEKTNTDTSPDAWHTIGDSAGMVPHMDVTFSIPAEDAEAVGITLDTTTFADGEHTITATAGDKTTTAKVIVDNTIPSIETGILEGSVLYDRLILEEGSIAADANGVSEIAVSLDDEILELPAVIVPRDLPVGGHTLKVVAVDNGGNVAAEEIHFNTVKVDPNVTGSKNDEIKDTSVRLSVSLGDEIADVTFLEGRSLTVENEGITSGGVVSSANGESPYQIFQVNVGETNPDDQVAVTWKGTASNTDASHPLTMYAWNTAVQRWDAIGNADADGNIQTAFTAQDYVTDGHAVLLVQCLTNGIRPKADVNAVVGEAEEAVQPEQSSWDGTGRPEKYDFAFAWETDTQYYSESFPYHYDNMNQWIADNAEEWNIRYVFHTGDIVDDCNMTGEWVNADHSMKILDDAGIPYGVLGGNHDVWAGAEDYGNYWAYFGEDRFAGKDYYGGSYKNNRGHYDLLTENGQDFIIVYMSWDIYQEELNWMNEVLQQYADRKAILAFHRYINTSGDLDYTGKLIQDQVVSENPNVFAVIDGHYHGAAINTQSFDDDGDGVQERVVYQICTDYQSDPEGGSEYIKFMYFDLEDNKLYMNSYSPYRDDFNYYDTEKLSYYGPGTKAGAIDIYEFDLDFENEEKTLTTESIRADVRTSKEIINFKDATGDVVHIWDSLLAETAYGWYAKVTNARNGITYTAVQSFSTDEEKLPYEDVKEDDWHYRAVRFAYKNKIMTGWNGNTFGPYEKLSRAQFAVILHRMNGAPKIEYTDVFKDVADDQWYTDAILWAQDTGVVTGYNDGSGLFGVSDDITREQLAIMMYRYAVYKGYSVEGGTELSKFADEADVSASAEEAMKWAVGNGIIVGKNDGAILDPHGNAARSECAAIIMRFMECYNRQTE